MKNKKGKVCHEARLRAMLYQLDTGDNKGMWTFFIRLGEDNPASTFHAEHAFDKKEGALKAVKKVILKFQKDMAEAIPGALWDIRKWS